MTSLLLATSNAGKVRELRDLFAATPQLAALTLRTPNDLPLVLPDVAETGATFAENARLKATQLARASGMIALADDSGLCVDALGGEPGVHSARWAGPTDADRNRALLARLEGVPPERRSARYVCVVCAATPEGAAIEAEGVCDGTILTVARGDGGFGYDPLFFLPELGRTFAEISLAEKNRYSHRSLALQRLISRLAGFLGTHGARSA